MSSPSLKTRFFFKLLKRARFGTLILTLPDGKVETFGTGSPELPVEIKNWKVVDLIFSKGDLGLAEAIISGDLIVEKEAELIAWACNNDSELARTMNGTWYGTLAHKLKSLVTSNDRRGAQKNIHVHDTLGNEFFRLWLDPTITYSCGIYRTPEDTLETAQKNKFKKIIDTLGIKAGDHVLDIGCGWGGFYNYAVKNTHCRVTAVTNSPEQFRHNQKFIVEENISDQVDLQHCDYRDIRGVYDKIVVVEMLEVVGEKYWPVFFEKLKSLLAPGGQILIQTSTIQEELFEQYKKNPDFIEQYIFNGGLLPTRRALKETGQMHGFELVESYDFSSSYVSTLQDWQKNFQKALKDVKDMGFDEKFIRMWKLYLTYCEGTILAGRVNVGQFTFRPKTRP